MNSKIFKWAGLKKKLVMVAILSFSLGMSMTSCTDWLGMESYTSDDVDYIFENEAKADLFVQGCYRGLIHKEMFYNLGMGETVVHTAEDGFSSKYKACNYDLTHWFLPLLQLSLKRDTVLLNQQMSLSAV